MTKLGHVLTRVRASSRELALLPEAKIKAVLKDCAIALKREQSAILAVNQQDLSRLEPASPLYARLELTKEKISDIAAGLKQIANLPSPLNRILESRTLPNGLKLSRRSVPLGVIGVIYESRPNVTADVFALAFKSGNACVLKGGKEAQRSSAAIIKIIKKILRRHGINPYVVELISGGRSEAQQLMRAHGLVDLIIPRGGPGLISYVRDHATVPVIETGAGVVHTYVDANVNVAQAARIIDNAKTNRPAACNALDTLLVHRAQLKNLPRLVAPLARSRVIIFADAKSYRALASHYPAELLRPATAKHFGREFLALQLAVKSVDNLDEALAHINRHSSQHSEAILSADKQNCERFLAEVDAAVVYGNAATTLSDGGVFGLGAEVGISTQKLHARGPMGLSALTTYKWIARGTGQIRR